ncbi:MAG: metallophosphoesterase family protein [Terriglobales bacterium]|jgi:protein phosphatase
MKIVIISDLHGNYEALRALPEAYDELWVLGDLVNYGPQPCEVVDAIRAEATLVVRGNHDNAIGFDQDPKCGIRFREMAQTTGKFTASVISREQKDFLSSLPLKVTAMRGTTRFYLTHAMPSDPLYGYSPHDSNDWVTEVEGVPADVVLVGHTHHPFIRTIGKQTLVNPGSLGQPKNGSSNACYAVWQDTRIELKQYAYPVEKTVSRIQALPLPDAVRQDLVKVLRAGAV